jgi:DNA-binding HxlR family transcriptional regulator
MPVNKAAQAPRRRRADPVVCDRFHRAVELVGRRWTGAVLSALSQGASRFCEVRGAVPGISDRLLTERLRELEDEGVVERRVTRSRPPQVDYVLTDKGRALRPVLDAVAAWAATWTASAPRRSSRS